MSRDAGPVPPAADDGPEAWAHALREAVEGGCSLLHRAEAVAEVGSTQDHARALGLPSGSVVAAWRQTAGRGRLGRAWQDTGTEGVAVTFVLDMDLPERLAARSAVAAARAARRFAGGACGIKWPNDVVHEGRKLAGVLVECADGRAWVGVGMNVLQRSFPPPLDRTATSLAMRGSPATRLEVLRALVQEVDRAFGEPIDDVYRTYSGLDRLTGRRCAFRTPEGPVEGLVERVDPARGLEVRTDGGTRFLPSATTSVVPGPVS